MRFEKLPPSRTEPFLMSPTLPVMPGRLREARAPPYQKAYSSALNGIPPAGLRAPCVLIQFNSELPLPM